MPKSLPLLIESLLEAGRYRPPAQNVELIETHASWVLLAGDFAYKIKKPITLPFLDYGTLEKRLACCLAELRLNRRFAPATYLDVVPIFGPANDPHIGNEGESGVPLEFAVKMSRFDESGRLDHVCARGELTPDQVSALADAIVDFHRTAAIAPIETRFGSPAVVLDEALENFSELQTLLPDATGRLSALEDWTRAEFTRLAAQFAARKAAGRARECHGDLHLGNLVEIDGRITLFDCIEFSEDFRWIDVASEIAFTYVDLLDHQQPGLAAWLLNEWLSRSGDFEALPVLRFYAVYRALVRAKVAAIRVRQCQTDIAETLTYLSLAEALAAASRPRLIITHGLSGCGKTRASTRLLLADSSAATLRLRSDVERKRLFGLNEAEKSNSPVDGGIYAPNANELTYQRLFDLAQQMLTAGWSVVVDAAFLKRAERDAFYRLALALGAEFGILAPEASHEQLRKRIEARLAKGRDASEATPAVLEKQMCWIEPLDSNERRFLLPYHFDA